MATMTDTDTDRTSEQRRMHRAEAFPTMDAPPKGRRGMAAGRVFIAMLVCLLGWGVLYGPELQRTSRAQPESLRRTISLAVLAPVTWMSDLVGLSAVTDGAASALGRDPDAPVGGTVDFPIEVEDIPTFSPTVPPSPGGGRPGKGDGNGGQGPVVRDTRMRVPTGTEKLRIAVVGDSLAAGIGFYAERVFKPIFTDVVKQGQISTGLARPDFFNWPSQMQEIVDRFRPDLTIVMLGENDNQSLQTPGGDLDTAIGTFEWQQAYEDRVERFATIATSEGGHVIWVGLPNERDEGRWAFTQRQNDMFERVADRLPNVAFYDTWTEFAKPDGGYTAYWRDGNNVKLIRADDGVHFNGDGYTVVMENVARFTTDEFRLDPKTYDA
jgi:lysophospholipase L1-like esterase